MIRINIASVWQPQPEESDEQIQVDVLLQQSYNVLEQYVSIAIVVPPTVLMISTACCGLITILL